MERYQIWKIKSISAQKGRTSVTVGIATRIESENWVRPPSLSASHRRLGNYFAARVAAREKTYRRSATANTKNDSETLLARGARDSRQYDKHLGRWTCPPYDSNSAGSWNKRTYRMDLPSLRRSIWFSARRALSVDMCCAIARTCPYNIYIYI